MTNDANATDGEYTLIYVSGPESKPVWHNAPFHGTRDEMLGEVRRLACQGFPGYVIRTNTLAVVGLPTGPAVGWDYTTRRWEKGLEP